MQKNNFCPLPNKVLIYEEIDAISQSIFNSKKKLFTKDKYINLTKEKYKDIFLKNSKFFCIYCSTKLFNSTLKKDELLIKYHSYKDSNLIFPKREFYFKHHLEFLERPNLINIYFNKKEKIYGIEKLNEYQFQKKKEKLNITKNSLKSDKKIFNTNVLEKIENYSTTITQSSNNEKNNIHPLKIFKRCEDNKKIEINKNDNKDKKSKLTFSESRISNSSKNILDESLIKMIKELPDKDKSINKNNIYKKEKHKISISKFFNNNKKDINNKFNKNNQIIFNMDKFIKKEKSKNKRISTSSKRKNNKQIYNILNPNSLINNNRKRTSFVINIKNIKTNKSNTLYNFKKKNKAVINSKESNIISKKNRNNILGNNTTLKNNIKKKNNIVESISFNTVEEFINYFMTPKNTKIYGDVKIKRQNKKNSALTFVNNINNTSKNNSEEKYKKSQNKENILYKSKSPIRLFYSRNEKNEENKNKSKKRKSVLLPEHNLLHTKSINIFKKKNNNNNIYRNNKKSINNAVNMSHNFDSNRRSSFKYIKYLL